MVTQECQFFLWQSLKWLFLVSSWNWRFWQTHLRGLSLQWWWAEFYVNVISSRWWWGNLVDWMTFVLPWLAYFMKPLPYALPLHAWEQLGFKFGLSKEMTLLLGNKYVCAPVPRNSSTAFWYRCIYPFNIQQFLSVYSVSSITVGMYVPTQR